MRKLKWGLLLIAVFVAIYFFIFRIPDKPNVNISLLPMYGNTKKTEEQKRTDSIFIEESLKQTGSLEQAAKHAVSRAWGFLNMGDLDNSMRRLRKLIV